MELKRYSHSKTNAMTHFQNLKEDSGFCPSFLPNESCLLNEHIPTEVANHQFFKTSKFNFNRLLTPFCHNFLLAMIVNVPYATMYCACCVIAKYYWKSHPIVFTFKILLQTPRCVLAILGDTWLVIPRITKTVCRATARALRGNTQFHA